MLELVGTTTMPPSTPLTSAAKKSIKLASEVNQDYVDQTPAICVAAISAAAIVVFVIVYVLYQKRILCFKSWDRHIRGEQDLSGNEALITPVHKNTNLESADMTNGLVSGMRTVPTRRNLPEKWYDSSALKFIDQSTDTLDQV